MLFGKEPVAWTGLIKAAIVCGTAFGFSLTPQQIVAVYALAEAVFTIVARQQVTPVKKGEPQ